MMETDVIEDIRMLREVLERMGLKQLSETLVENMKNCAGGPDQLLRYCWQMSQNTAPTPKPSGEHAEYFDYVLYGMLRSNGDKHMGQNTGVVGSPKSQHRIPKGPFSIIFTTVFVSIFKKIKVLAMKGHAIPFQRAVRRFTALISRMLNGAYGYEFYNDLESEDVKRIVFLLRTLLSIFLDTQIDKIYQTLQLPLHTVFVWARCIVHVVNMINGLKPQYVDGFEHDLMTDFKGKL
ncbi:hypothetical protein X943_003006 [Babesia divergens]|uniref:Uncharacterized protein n=1 Tax=Babesia divergens TaxID=32595 RepID=A0AAD9GFN6_BABDI|nr:hypothetical protein X943_003006 [Babesia divergens]